MLLLQHACLRAAKGPWHSAAPGRTCCVCPCRMLYYVWRMRVVWVSLPVKCMDLCTTPSLCTHACHVLQETS